MDSKTSIALERKCISVSFCEDICYQGFGTLRVPVTVVDTKMGRNNKSIDALQKHIDKQQPPQNACYQIAPLAHFTCLFKALPAFTNYAATSAVISSLRGNVVTGAFCVHSTTNAFKAVHVPMFSNTCTSPSLAFQNESFSFPEIYQYTTHYSNEVYVFFSTDDANVFAKLAHGPSVYNVMTL